jgi:hypothetical protein
VGRLSNRERADRLRSAPEVELLRKDKTVPDREQERKAREPHIEKIEADTRTERGKAEERSGIDKEVEKELQTVRPGAGAPSRAGVVPEGSGADGERG